MYQIENGAAVLAARGARRPRRPWINATVLGLGVTSLFTDISAEMVTTVLPLYLVFGLHVAPMAFGVVDGLYTGATAPVRLVAGIGADRLRRHKEIAAVGYGLSTVARLGMLLVGNVWTAMVGLVLLDRTGKGIRTAPRDAMISLSASPAELGAAFGAHRALDMVGAMLGPLLTFLVLALAPGRFDAVFVVSLCAGVIGLAVVTLFVRNPPDPGGHRRRTTIPLRDVVRIVRVPGFTQVLVIGTVLSVATLSDGFLYLTLQDRLGFDVGFFPLLYVGTSLVYFLVAVPVGRLADRVGRGAVFVGGYVLVLVVYASLLLPWHERYWLVGCLVLLGVSFAATDGVLMALASALLPEPLRTSGLGSLTTATSLANLASSLLFGLLWTTAGVTAAIGTFCSGLLVAVVVAGVVLTRRRSEEPDGSEALGA